jgi:hypothetical protein
MTVMEILAMLKAAWPLLAIGGAWGGAKVALNGTRERVAKLEDNQEGLLDRTARIETKIDILVEREQ